MDFSLSESSDDLISSVFTVNPAILADTNLANPSCVIDELAFKSVDCAPLIVAGVLILLAVKSASIIASAPITNRSFLGSK